MYEIANQRFLFSYSIQNGRPNCENDRQNEKLRKTKNKISIHVDFESLMMNMAIFFSSVASLPRKITEKTVKTVF